jgi:arsenical pump membrane protein
VLAGKRAAPWPVLRGVSWSVLPLVAGLFVLVEGLNRTGVIAVLVSLLEDWAYRPVRSAAIGGVLVAIVTNLTNNLPAGLIAGSVVHQASVPDAVPGALLIGVDLGPNLSITGSLATILWLLALRREGQVVGFWDFLKLGALVMSPALVLALAALILTA